MLELFFLFLLKLSEPVDDATSFAVKCSQVQVLMHIVYLLAVVDSVEDVEDLTHYENLQTLVFPGECFRKLFHP